MSREEEGKGKPFRCVPSDYNDPPYREKAIPNRIPMNREQMLRELSARIAEERRCFETCRMAFEEATGVLRDLERAAENAEDFNGDRLTEANDVVYRAVTLATGAGYNLASLITTLLNTCSIVPKSV